ncbi:hypothetical protein D9M69_535910 [compost metagenome]
MHDEAGVGAPDVLGNRRGQHRCDDERGRVLAHRFAQGLVVAERQHDACGVAPVLELGQHALREAVERARDEQDVHGDLIDVCF